MELQTSIVRSATLPGQTACDPDAALVAAAKADTRAFVCLDDRYFDQIFGYVRLRIGNRATSEDVTSQVFVNALAKIDGFRGHGPSAAWYFGSPAMRCATSSAAARPSGTLTRCSRACPRPTPARPRSHSLASVGPASTPRSPVSAATSSTSSRCVTRRA